MFSFYAANTVWAVPRAHSLAVLRQGTTLVTDSSAYFSSDCVAIRATLRLAFGFPFAGAISKVQSTP